MTYSLYPKYLDHETKRLNQVSQQRNIRQGAGEPRRISRALEQPYMKRAILNYYILKSMRYALIGKLPTVLEKYLGFHGTKAALIAALFDLFGAIHKVFMTSITPTLFSNRIVLSGRFSVIVTAIGC